MNKLKQWWGGMRWQKIYQQQASLVAIGVGQYADLEALRKLTPNVVHLNAQTDEDFKKFIDWVSQSVVALLKRFR